MPPRSNVQQRNVRDVTIDDLRREIESLQERLAHYELQKDGVNVQQLEEGEEENPFYQDCLPEESSGAQNMRRQRQGERTWYRHYEAVQAQQQSRDYGIKMGISEFDGRMNPDEFCDWLMTVERVLECKEIPDDKIVRVVAVKLVKHASVWWENLKRMRQREGREKIVTWAKMKKALLCKYLPDQYRQNLFLKLHHQQQQQQQQRRVGAHLLNGSTNGIVGCDPLMRQNKPTAKALVVKLHEERLKIPLQRNSIDDGSMKQRFSENVGHRMDASQASMLKSTITLGRASGQIIQGSASTISGVLHQVQARNQQHHGVRKGASASDIKTAYYGLTKKLPSDTDKNDPDTPKKFQEVPRAYEVLKDDEKKSLCDQVGPDEQADSGGGSSRPFGGDGFRSAFDDFVSGDEMNENDFFKDFFRDREYGCEDVNVSMEISFMKAVHGGTKTLTFQTSVPCEPCGGRGVPPGGKIETCQTCKGMGAIFMQRGCSNCRESGQAAENPCQSCKVDKGLRKTKSLKLDVMPMNSNKPLMMFGFDPPGTSPPNQLWNNKVQAVIERFVEDGSLDENIESFFFSHADTDPREVISRCKNVTEVGKLLATGGHDKKAVLWFMDNLKSKSTLGEHSILSYLTDAAPRKFMNSTSGTNLFVTTLYEVEVLAWIGLRKERFPHGSFSKLKSRANGPFGIRKKLSDIAYQIDLPGKFHSSTTFNMVSPRYEGEAPPTPGE